MKKTIPLARPWFTEAEATAAANVVRSGWLISGPIVQRFEKEFAKKIGAKYAVAVNSGSSALLIAQQALGIGRGDEVIVPDMTFISTATSSLYLGACPVFADIELSTYGIDPTHIEKHITPRTKAIIPVHYAGQAADMEGVLSVAKKHNLFVIEDAAEAHLATYHGRPVGTFGDIGIFSFTPSKPMTTGEGGMLVTNNEKLARKCRLIRNFHDKGKFEHTDFGFHFRMPEVMGAIGLVQLKKLSAAIKKRRSLAAAYTKAFSRLPLILPTEREVGAMKFQLYTLRLDLANLTVSRDEFVEKLLDAGIQSRLYYPPLHRQGVFRKKIVHDDSEFPNTTIFAKSAFSLPIYPGLKIEEQTYIISTVKKIIHRYRR